MMKPCFAELRIILLLLACGPFGAVGIVAAAEPPAGNKNQSDKPAPIEIAEIQRDTPINFATEVHPILSKHCNACHSAATAEAGLVLQSPESILKGGDSGPAIVPGNWSESLLMKLAAHREEPIMPPPENQAAARPLSPEQLGILKRWIEQGGKGDVTRSTTSIPWQPLAPEVQPTLALAISHDGTWLAAGRGKQIDVYDLREKKFAATLVDPETNEDGQADRRAGAHRDLVQAIAFDPEGKRMASAGYRRIKLWRLEQADSASDHAPGQPPAWRLEQVIGGHDGEVLLADRVLTLDFSPDGKLLAAGGGEPSRSGELLIWDLDARTPMHHITSAHSDTIFCVRFSPDGKHLATAGADRLAKLLAVADGSQVLSYAGHTHHVLSLAWKADGTLLVTAGADGVLKTWGTDNDAARRTIKGPEAEATSVDFLGGGVRLAASIADQSIRIYNVDNGAVVQTLRTPPGYVHRVAATPDGKLLAAGGDDGVVRIWDTSSGQLIDSLTRAE